MEPNTQNIINLLQQARSIHGPRSVLPQDYPNEVSRINRLISQLSKQAILTSGIVQEHKPSYDRFKHLMTITAQWLNEDDKKINETLKTINSHYQKLKKQIPV